jgi:hypothetical protein
MLEEKSAVTDRRTQIIARTGILADNDREVDGYHKGTQLGERNAALRGQHAQGRFLQGTGGTFNRSWPSVSR